MSSLLPRSNFEQLLLFTPEKLYYMKGVVV